MLHAEPMSDGERRLVRGREEGEHLIEPERLEPVRRRTRATLGCVAVVLVGGKHVPADLVLVVAARYWLAHRRADRLPGVLPLDRPEPAIGAAVVVHLADP